MTKTFKVIISIVQTVIVLVLVGITIMTFSYKIPFLARIGVTFYTVLSGSMEPAIPTGSVIYSGGYKIEELQKGDIITFNRADSEGQNTVVTHRIEEVKKQEIAFPTPEDKNKKLTQLTFKTKGDSNGAVDEGEVYPNQILGKYRWHIPKLGNVAMFAQTPNGFVLLVIIPAAILIIWEVVSVITHFKKKYEKKSQDEIEKMKEELIEQIKPKKKSRKKKGEE